jgi:hypothetical protein
LPRQGYYFVLIQSSKKSSQQKGFFAALAIALQTGQNHGLESFAAHAHCSALLQNFLCPCHPQATIVMPAFARSCFADAELLDSENYLILKIQIQIKFALRIEADTRPRLRPVRV